MRFFLKCASSLGLNPPPYPRDSYKESCPSYHIKGLCNYRYRREGEHVPYFPGGYRALMVWDITVILGEEGRGGGIE